MFIQHGKFKNFLRLFLVRYPILTLENYIIYIIGTNFFGIFKRGNLKSWKYFTPKIYTIERSILTFQFLKSFCRCCWKTMFFKQRWNLILVMLGFKSKFSLSFDARGVLFGYMFCKIRCIFVKKSWRNAWI